MTILITIITVIFAFNILLGILLVIKWKQPIEDNESNSPYLVPVKKRKSGR